MKTRQLDLFHDYKPPPGFLDIATPGTVVETNYNSGPYIVVSVKPWLVTFNMALVLEDDFLAKPTVRSLKGEYMLNGYRAVGGRLVCRERHSEAFVRRFNPEAAALLARMAA
ncbi:MAG: hypothetical protein ACOH2M_18585 [Cypionkella sp.]